MRGNSANELRSARGRRSKGTSSRMAAAAAVVLFVAVGSIAMPASMGSWGSTVDGEERGKAVPQQSFVGLHWNLTAITDVKGSTFEVPAEAGAFVEFHNDGTMLAKDTVNAMSGPYRITLNGVQISPLGTTFAGYFGGDPVRKAIRAAFRAMFIGTTEASGSIALTLAHQGTHLTLTNHTQTLTFEQHVASPDAPTRTVLRPTPGRRA